MSVLARAIDWGDRLPLLVGRAVHLRMLEESDLGRLYDIFGDAQVVRYWSSPPIADLAAARALLEEIHDCFRLRTLFQWGIADRGDDRLLGTITLHRLDLDHARAEVGFALARDAWRRGAATDALGTLLRFAFDELGLHRIEADTDPRNERSIRLLERHGFQREGLLRERYHVLGEWQDAVLFGLLAAAWRR